MRGAVRCAEFRNRRRFSGTFIDVPGILLFTTDLEIGGTPSVVRELAIRLRGGGTNIAVACLSGWGPNADAIAKQGIAVSAMNAHSALDFGAIARLHRFISRGQFDTVFSFLMHANVAAALTTLPCFATRKIRLIQSIQTTQRTPRWHWMAQTIAARFADRVIVPSRSVAHAAKTWCGIPRDKIVMIPNAVDPRSFDGIGRPFASSNDDSSGYMIGFVGRLDPIKRIGDLIEAMIHLPAQVRLCIYGEGCDRADIEAKIARLNLSGRVTLKGIISRPQDALGEIDVMVLPSDAEGFGLVLIEAMAAGVPIVATRVPGIVDVITHEQTGLLVPPRLPIELARAIERIAHDPRLRDRLIQAARRDVEHRFSWEGALKHYELQITNYKLAR